jgi:hypothetical protein
MCKGLCKDKRIYSILSDPIEMVPSGVVVVPVCPREIHHTDRGTKLNPANHKCNTSVRRQDKHENMKVQREVGKHTSYNRQ